jgi:hypothetical protein
MEVDLSERAYMYADFDAYVSQMTGLSPSTKLVAQAWRRIQDTRTEQHDRYDGMYLCALWELEKATGLTKSTVRDGLSQLVKFGIIGKRVIRAMRNKKGEIHLSKISISSLEQADLNGDIPQSQVKPVPRCSCGDVHVVDTMTRTCKSCGTVQQLYQIDHAAHYDQVMKFYSSCLVKRDNCHVPLGQMMKLYHVWFWQQEDPGTKKPLKSELVKRILHELGVNFKKNNTFRRYEGVGLTLYAQELLEGLQS